MANTSANTSAIICEKLDLERQVRQLSEAYFKMRERAVTAEATAAEANLLLQAEVSRIEQEREAFVTGLRQFSLAKRVAERETNSFEVNSLLKRLTLLEVLFEPRAV